MLLYVAEILAEALLITGLVFTGNVAVVAPATATTLVGTVAPEGLPVVIVTAAPPDGAGPLRVTVPTEELPPTSDVGFKLRELMVGRDGL